VNRATARVEITEYRDDAVARLKKMKREFKRMNSLMVALVALVILMFAVLSGSSMREGDVGMAVFSGVIAFFNLFALRRALNSFEEDEKFYATMQGFIDHFNEMLRVLDEEEKAEQLKK
jgi:ABC-type transport system involved in cytochrome bd biosynthesis fused ATPase/permease subunit